MKWKACQWLVSIMAAIACTVFLNPAPVAGQAAGIESEIAAVEASMAEGMGAHWDLIAPKAFEEARGKLEEAKERFKKGGKIEDIRQKLQEAKAKLKEAAQLEEMGKLLLKNALLARGDAIEAKATEFAPEEWNRAKDTMRNAGREVEKGNQNQARNKAAEAEVLFRDAELQAIRADLLGQAKKVRTQALEVEADEKARQIFAQAEKQLERAERVLQGDRYQRAEAKDLAREATLGFKHASLVAEKVDVLGARNEGAVEKLFIEYEEAVGKIATALSLDMHFSEGFVPVTEAVLSAVNSLQADRDNLQAELLDREQQLKTARATIDSLDTTLAALENRERSTAAAMEAERKRQRDLKSVQDLFGSHEATVLLQGDNLIIRLYGLSFQVGSSVIQPENFQLLTKLQSALRTFPGAPVYIEGHTDAAGDDHYNQALSLKRAEAVRSYLMANMAGDEERLHATGFGETVPLASNETVEGRAKNRRIDVRIDTGVQ